MKKYLVLLFAFASVMAVTNMSSCRKAQVLPAEDMSPYLSGGMQTVFDASETGFSQDFPVLSGAKAKVHDIGDIFFETNFVAAPSSINPGLGPLYNNISCISCHSNEGEGNPPLTADGKLTSMLFRLSIPGTDAHGGPNPVPGFGGQLQNNATVGSIPEGSVNVSYSNEQFSFFDGTTYQLQVPNYTITNTYIPFPGNAMSSPRIAQRLVGLGLLEAVPDEEILQLAMQQRANGDSIHGTPNYVWDEAKQQTVIGRFGWKAGQPTILQQTAAAFNQDMGITNYIFNQESCYGQSQYKEITGDPDPEISDSLLYAVKYYVQTLAVPARRDVNDAKVLQGQKIFTAARCSSCHTPVLTTGVNIAAPEVSNQTIFPYTDLLLHDMGVDLADNRPEYLATGQQWRTAPLWGIGLTQLINPNGHFLHDGRARTIMEAIMWHGGEAEVSKNYVQHLSQTDRDALLAFINSL